MALSKAAAGRLGGLKGGKARDRKLTVRRKHEIAVQGAAARWKAVKQGKRRAKRR